VVGDFNLYYPNWNNPGRFLYYLEVDQLAGIIANNDMNLALLDRIVT